MGNNNDIGFFEGAEKLLELWFTRTDGPITSDNDLRRIPGWAISMLLNDIGCKIVSFEQGPYLDAYVLSESSLFIGQRHFILKTCGSIAQLRCIPIVLNLAKVYAGFEDIEDVFYSRKNFMKPELQLMPHRKFDEEVRYLEKYFKGELVYKFGRFQESNWYLYTLDKPRSVKSPDQTIELMMTGLDSHRSRSFQLNISEEDWETNELLTPCKNLRDFFPDCMVDEHLFEPCGYSCNVLMCGGMQYFTVHVTPEDGFSYASFECNSKLALSTDCIKSVLECFDPDRFIATMFANENSSVYGFVKTAATIHIPGYTIRDTKVSPLKNYVVAYLFFVKAGVS